MMTLSDFLGVIFFTWMTSLWFYETCVHNDKDFSRISGISKPINVMLRSKFYWHFWLFLVFVLISFISSINDKLEKTFQEILLPEFVLPLFLFSAIFSLFFIIGKKTREKKDSIPQDKSTHNDIISSDKE